MSIKVKCLVSHSSFTEPTAPPTKVQGYSLNSTSIFISWHPPPIENQNGIIRYYYINIANIMSRNGQTFITIVTHFLFKNLEPNSSYSFTVSAYTVALGPASEQIVVNTEPEMSMLSNSSNELHNNVQYKSEIKGISTSSAALGALTAVFAILTIVLAIAIGILACFYQNIKKRTRYILYCVSYTVTVRVAYVMHAST